MPTTLLADANHASHACIRAATDHGIDHFLVRGLAKVTCVALLGAITSNLLQHATTLLGG